MPIDGFGFCRNLVYRLHERYLRDKQVSFVIGLQRPANATGRWTWVLGRLESKCCCPGGLFHPAWQSCPDCVHYCHTGGTHGFLSVREFRSSSRNIWQRLCWIPIFWFHEILRY